MFLDILLHWHPELSSVILCFSIIDTQLQIASHERDKNHNKFINFSGAFVTILQLCFKILWAEVNYLKSLSSFCNSSNSEGCVEDLRNPWCFCLGTDVTTNITDENLVYEKETKSCLLRYDSFRHDHRTSCKMHATFYGVFYEFSSKFYFKSVSVSRWFITITVIKLWPRTVLICLETTRIFRTN